MTEPTNVFHCKEPGCKRRVRYQYEGVAGASFTRRRREEAELVSVYLTCEDGHVHKYFIDVFATRPNDGR